MMMMMTIIPGHDDGDTTSIISWTTCTTNHLQYRGDAAPAIERAGGGEGGRMGENIMGIIMTTAAAATTTM